MDNCYICLEEETETRPFMKHSPCKCKGTMVIHEHCAERVRSKGKCMQCRTVLPDQPYLNKNEYVVDKDQLIYSKVKNGLKQGLEYTFTMSNNRKILFAIKEYSNGIMHTKFDIVFPGHEKEVDISSQLATKSIREQYLNQQNVI